MRNPREQIGYITVGLLSQCVLDGKCLERVTDSLCTVVDPSYKGQTPFRDLAFQTYQERDVLERTLKREGITCLELIGMLRAGTAKPFFSALAKQAVIDANSRNCRVPPSVRQLVRLDPQPEGEHRERA